MPKLSLKKEYQKYSVYKDSGVDWIGQIPEKWDPEKLRKFFVQSKNILGVNNSNHDLLSLTLRGVVPKSKDDAFGKIPDNYDAYQSVNVGELIACLFDYDVTPRTIGIAKQNGMVTGAYTILRGKRDCDPRFYYYYLLFLDETKELLHLCVGLRSTLKKNIFYNLPVPAPNFEVQKKLADFLDEKVGLVEKIIEKKQKLIGLLKEKRAAIINQAVTKGLDPKAELVDSGIDWIGRIPKEWKVRKIFHSFDIIGSGTTPSSGDQTLYDDGEINWAITGDLNDGELYQTSNKITKAAFLASSALQIYPIDTLLVAMYGATIGKVTLLKIPACTNQACCALADSSFFNIKFIFYWFLGNKQNIIDNFSYGGGQPNISQNVIKSLRIQCPVLAEQNNIVVYLNKKMSDIQNTFAGIEKSIKLLNEFKSSLISNVVTGKIKI